jgi:hypothetical protein
MSWLPSWLGGGNQEPVREQVTMYIDLTCEKTGEPFSIGGFSLPAAHDSHDKDCMCVMCFHNALHGVSRENDGLEYDFEVPETYERGAISKFLFG